MVADLPPALPISRYRTMLFDCDGVLLNSNRLKTEAFRDVASQFGDQPAQALVDYHVARGGVSRQRKFAYFAEQIIGADEPAALADRLVQEYGEQLRSSLSACEVAPGLAALKRATTDAQWGVVSGGSQAELREIFAQRDIDQYFELGIWGNPIDKPRLVANLRRDRALVAPVLFIGDSQYDHEIALEAGFDFLFVSAWSEFGDWRAYCSAHTLPAVPYLNDLLDEPVARGLDH